ncbi:beta propeller repeat protein [Chryseobacterium vrystaatense]|uniref:BNR/Asp-box repeat-containing protein n=1 Tax=Chryseobacterium vrystaatense TaxID=307480 RepID=A0A1M4TR18_9FLAO|nr:hypothetical protein [Chryseobacterium vrystaatense]KFF28448.1 hypothetical protein IW16_04420 [Chryseobacterium vrystaatense]SHE46834.1 hypothetical protein SAMN02787073_0420 [Chryseobacterium vrystaatense]
MITKKYSKINFLNFLPFVNDIVKSNKSEELLSFLIWEFSWFFFKKNIKQVQFVNEKPSLLFNKSFNEVCLILHPNFCESSDDFSLVYFDKNSGIFGSMISNPSKLFFKDGVGNIVQRFDFDNNIEGIFIDSRGSVFVCCGGIVFKSTDSGFTFKKVLAFSSDQSRFLFETITETENNEILIGEYANVKKDRKWIFVGYIYISYDAGESWKKSDFLKNKINKHIHIVKWIKSLKYLVLTEGDNKKGIWINNSNNYILQGKSKEKGWFRLNKFHIQKGGYTSLVETKKNIILGTDYYMGTNFIVSTANFKKFSSAMIPDPYRKSAVFRMLYLRNGMVWGSLYNHVSPNRSLLMYSRDFGKTWYKFLEYDGSMIKMSIVSNSGEDCFYVLIEDLFSDQFKTYKMYSLDKMS